jgi:hypothetical protein
MGLAGTEINKLSMNDISSTELFTKTITYDIQPDYSL